MRVTTDTNTVISALFWKGNPRKILDAARDEIIELFTTEPLLDELERVLSRERFKPRLLSAETTVKELVDGYAALAEIVEPALIEAVVIRDPDDDVVIACAVASDSEAIVSGDDDLLSIGIYREIRIISAARLIGELNL